MRLRHLLPITLLAVGALIAPACSGDDSSDTASGSSNDRDTASPTTGSSDSNDSENPGDVPGLDDLTESIPGLGDMGDCINQAAAFSSLYFEALGGEGGAKEAQKKAEELKQSLPSDLHDDLDVISEAIGKVADEGLLSGTDALDTEEYKKAEEAISKYFQEECGGGG